MIQQAQKNKLNPVCEMRGGIFGQVAFHALPYAIVYLCDERGRRGMPINIKRGKKICVGDRQFSFADGKKVTFQPYGDYDDARNRKIDRSLAGGTAQRINDGVIPFAGERSKYNLPFYARVALEWATG